MAYRFTGAVQSFIEFALGPMALYTFGPYTMATMVKFSTVSTTQVLFDFMDSGDSTNKLLYRIPSANVNQILQGGSASGAISVSSTSVWYILAVTRASGSSSCRFHVWNGSTWAHEASTTNTIANATMVAGDRFRFAIGPGGSGNVQGDAVCAGIKKTDSTDLAIQALSATSFAAWASFGFDWLVGFDAISSRVNVASPGSGNETSRGSTSPTLVSDPPGWSWATTTTHNGSATVSMTATVTSAGTNTGPSITAWAWNFGDGGTSTLRNPTHTYTVAGSYTVTLTVTNSLGLTDGETKTSYVLAIVPAIVNGSATVSLTVSITSGAIIHAFIHGSATVTELVAIASSTTLIARASAVVTETVSISSSGKVVSFTLVPAVEEEFVLTSAAEDSFVLVPLYD